VAICATIMVGAALANQLGCDFHLAEIEEFLIKNYLNMRERTTVEDMSGASMDHVTAVLTGFLKDHVGETIRTVDTPPPLPGHPKKIQVIQQGFDDKHPYRLNVQWIINQNLLRISRPRFYEYIKRKEYSLSDVMNGLKEFYRMQTPCPRLNLAGGAHLSSGGPERLIILPVPTDPASDRYWMFEDMHSYTPADQMMPTPPATPQGQLSASPGASGSGSPQP